jgi:hypothetical protein
VAEAKDITSLSLEELTEVERLESELDQFIEKRAREAKTDTLGRCFPSGVCRRSASRWAGPVPTTRRDASGGRGDT